MFAVFRAADNRYVLRVNPCLLGRFTLLFHRAGITAAFTAAIITIAARSGLLAASRAFAFHRANAVFTAAFHRRFVRRVICFVVGKCHDCQSEDEQNRDCQ